jgi:hypothetical protein
MKAETSSEIQPPSQGENQPMLVAAVRTADGYPVLGPGFESSVPGLYFVGVTAAYSFGPICRFVAGTPFTARVLTRSAAASTRGR